VSRYITITQSNITDWGKRKHTISRPKKLGRITMTILLGTLLCGAGFLYIVQVNKLAMMGFEIKRLEKDKQQLEQENERLKIQSAELKSIYNLETNKQQMQMLAPSQVSYIEVEHPVAMK
jgi:cell division protein FtsL